MLEAATAEDAEDTSEFTDFVMVDLRLDVPPSSSPVSKIVHRGQLLLPVSIELGENDLAPE